MQTGSVQGSDADALSEGDNTEAHQQPLTRGSNRGFIGDPGYYYQQHFTPIPVAYHVTEEEWANHEQILQQQVMNINIIIRITGKFFVVKTLPLKT
jgi:hypothetical protein